MCAIAAMAAEILRGVVRNAHGLLQYVVSFAKYLGELMYCGR